MTAPAEPRARFRDLVAAEWIKMWSLRSPPWALAVSALLVVAINTNAAVADHNNWPGYPEGIRELFVPIWAMRDAFTIGGAMVLMLAAASIGALTLVGEYSTGQIRTTFAAVPARRSVLAAKTVVVTAVTAVLGAVAAVTSFAVTQAVLSGRRIGLPFDYPGATRVLLASALLAPVCALVGMALAALIRHTATTIVTLTLLLLVLPSLVTERDHATASLLHALPQGAWAELVTVGDSPVPVTYPTTIAGSWIVYGLWSLAAVVVAVVAVHHRDPAP
ncbi:ABC transporter permease [Streptomyces camponoticapitis]|uniref:ABC transporter permease n=1 Tax=Streptomyces camponoticapitis TaxID=1616125 RepID=A0ABQ2DXW1_9ACTN|nr:ABC transporter permease [Streptomyces camponoticapitis]GGJ77853.1 ABC transporter permease [Streptomyces camponoticapitis]